MNSNTEKSLDVQPTDISSTPKDEQPPDSSTKSTDSSNVSNIEKQEKSEDHSDTANIQNQKLLDEFKLKVKEMEEKSKIADEQIKELSQKFNELNKKYNESQKTINDLKSLNSSEKLKELNSFFAKSIDIRERMDDYIEVPPKTGKELDDLFIQIKEMVKIADKYYEAKRILNIPENKSLDQEIQFLKKHDIEINDELNKTQSKLCLIEKENEDMKQDNMHLKCQLDAEKEKVSNLETHFSKKNSEEQSGTNNNSRIFELEKELADIKSKNQVMQIQLNEVEKENNKLKKENAEITDKLKLDTKLSPNKEKCTDESEIIQIYKLQLTDAIREKEALQKKLQEVVAIQNQLREKNETLSEEVKIAQEENIKQESFIKSHLSNPYGYPQFGNMYSNQRSLYLQSLKEENERLMKENQFLKNVYGKNSQEREIAQYKYELQQAYEKINIMRERILTLEQKAANIRNSRNIEQEQVDRIFELERQCNYYQHQIKQMRQFIMKYFCGLKALPEQGGKNFSLDPINFLSREFIAKIYKKAEIIKMRTLTNTEILVDRKGKEYLEQIQTIANNLVETNNNLKKQIEQLTSKCSETQNPNTNNQ